MKLEQARYPASPREGFGLRVLAASREVPRLRRPSLLPEVLDGVGWAAALWVGGFLLRELLR